MTGTIRNKISESGIINIDILDFMPKNEVKGIDLKDWLVDGLIIRERDFKEKLKCFDLESFKDKNVFIYCSVDVIIPIWAFLLLQVKLNKLAEFVFFGTKNEMNLSLFQQSVESKLKISEFKNKRVFIKGCGDPSLQLGFYSIVSQKLTPVVKSLFYGEACSNVPLIKNM